MIFENTTRWRTADLRAFLDRALAAANEAKMPVYIDCDTVILAVHSAALYGQQVRPDPSRRHAQNVVVLRLVTPEKAGADVVSRLGSLVTNGGAMPQKMVHELWAACLDLVRTRAWSFGQAPDLPKDLPGVGIQKKRDKSPIATRRQLVVARQKRDRVAEELAKHDRKVAKLEKELARETK